MKEESITNSIKSNLIIFIFKDFKIDVPYIGDNLMVEVAPYLESLNVL
jgi:hypothetical protein